MIAKNKNKNLSLILYSMFENIGGRCGAMRAITRYGGKKSLYFIIEKTTVQR